VRTVAEDMNDLDAKRAMREIAERYEHIAKRSEARAAGKRPAKIFAAIIAAKIATAEIVEKLLERRAAEVPDHSV
jgi:hypothetical protein